MDGRRTTFWIELRATDEVHAPTEEVPEVETIATEHVARLLYIEDNLANLRLIERLLALRNGAEVISAMTGELELDLAREHVPDLVLLDLGLPDLRGDEVLARLRRQPETAHIPVIILSAGAIPGEIKRLIALGAADYITKPIDIAVFMRMLDEHLSHRQGDGGDR